LLIVDGKPDLTICRSLDMGIITMINDIRTHINTNYELPIKEEHVLDVLMGKKTVLSAAVKREIVNKADAHAQAIISQLRELGIDLRVDAGIFIGGGSQLLKPYFDGSKALSAVEYIPNVNANAQGYETLARLSLRA
jgi:plasmid segregation protein ParM